MTALALWLVAFRIQLSPRLLRALSLAAVAEGLLYVAIAFSWQRFTVAVVNYLPAVIFFMVVVAILWRRSRRPVAALGILAVLLTFVSSAVQQGKVDVGPLGHNALYHAIEAVALLLLFLFGRWLVEQKDVSARMDSDRAATAR